jgi:GntR family transcriptional regulator
MIESLVLENQLPLGLAVNYIALGEEQSGDIDIDEPDVILILERQLGIQTSGSQTTVGAVAADEQTAELIGVALGAPRVWLTDSRGRCPSSGCGDRVAFSANAHRSA